MCATYATIAREVVHFKINVRGGDLVRCLVGVVLGTMVLAGCEDTPSVSKASADSAWKAVLSNSEGVGATATRVNLTTGIVEYSGPPRDFVSCSIDSQDVDVSQMSTVLDSRMTLKPLGAAVRVNTQYVVTISDQSPGSRSISFAQDAEGRFSNGVTCRATGSLEEKVLGRG